MESKLAHLVGRIDRMVADSEQEKHTKSELMTRTLNVIMVQIDGKWEDFGDDKPEGIPANIQMLEEEHSSLLPSHF